MDLRSKIILIYGPTASGKSKFAIQLAKKINGEIINADSMQIYKEFKLISARPYKSEYKKIRHHLYGFLSVKKKFSTGDWLKLVKQKIHDIKKRKKTPADLSLLVGISSIILSIFFILDGNMAINKPSIKNNKPKANTRSFILT